VLASKKVRVAPSRLAVALMLFTRAWMPAVAAMPREVPGRRAEGELGYLG